MPNKSQDQVVDISPVCRIVIDEKGDHSVEMPMSKTGDSNRHWVRVFNCPSELIVAAYAAGKAESQKRIEELEEQYRILEELLL